jgi:hypothetical protein
MRSSRRLAWRVLLAPLAGVLVATALAAQPDEHPATLQTLRTDGAAAALSDSRGGAAILRADDMTAGDSVAGDVTIGWSGQTPAAVVLAPGGLSGGLANALSIRVEDRTSGRRVYDGPLSAMGPVATDGFAPGTSHDFHFTVTLAPDAGDAYQGAAASLRFDWTATADDPPSTPEPPAVAPPAPEPTTPAPTPTNPAPTPVDTRPPLVKLAAGRLAVTASCDEPCTFQASARLSGARGVKKPKLVLRATGRRATVTLSFDRRSLATLRKLKSDKATVTVTATDAAGNRATAAKRIALTP